MDVFESGLEGLLPRSQWSRRGFVVTSLATGFALSVQPVSAETITTDANGLDAGEVKVPVADGVDPGLSRDAGHRAARSRPCSSSRRSSACTSTSRTSAAVWPRSAISRSRPSSTRARATRRRYTDIQELIAKIVVEGARRRR